MIPILDGDPLEWSVPRATAVTIGVFDGVHLGHRLVIERVVERSRMRGWMPTVLTFDPHPLEFISPSRAPKMLTTVPQRAELMARSGIEMVGVLPFPRIRDLAPTTFVVEVLHGRLLARHVTVGADFRFGRDRLGDPELLAALGAERGFEVEVVDMVCEHDGEVVSSTQIRHHLELGDVAAAGRLLGRPFELAGTVVRGESRGRSLGFPTANLQIPDRMAIPGDGVYAVSAAVGGAIHPAVVNIGVRPTFGVESRTVEAHLLDYEGDLYGAEMTLRFHARLRGEQRFASVDDLVAQIHTDVAEAVQVLAGIPSPAHPDR